MGDGVEVAEGDGGVVVFVGGITAFHGEDDQNLRSRFRKCIMKLRRRFYVRRVAGHC